MRRRRQRKKGLHCRLALPGWWFTIAHRCAQAGDRPAQEQRLPLPTGRLPSIKGQCGMSRIWKPAAAPRCIACF